MPCPLMTGNTKKWDISSYDTVSSLSRQPECSRVGLYRQYSNATICRELSLDILNISIYRLISRTVFEYMKLWKLGFRGGGGLWVGVAGCCVVGWSCIIKTHVSGFLDTDLLEVSWDFATHEAVRPGWFLCSTDRVKISVEEAIQNGFLSLSNT